MVFNEFPYTNFHELNQDWVTQKVVECVEDYLALDTEVKDLDKMFKGLKQYVNDFFNNLDISEEINNKIDSMALDGSLLAAIQAVRHEASREQGWRVNKIGKGYICSINKTETGISEAYLLSNTPPTDIPYCWYFRDPLENMLPLPITQAVVAGQSDKWFGTVINGQIIRKATLQHRDIFFARDVPTTGNPITTNTSLIVIGERADVPVNPPALGDVSKAQEAVDIAKSYYQARLNGRRFSYGENFITFNNSTIVNASDGSARMECDTLVALCMLGIDYANSPYSITTPSYQYNFDDMVINPNNYTWTLPWTYNAVVGRKVTYTGAECWYWWDQERVFSDIDQIAKGDIIIFRRDSDRPFFDGITHTGIIDIVNENGVDVPYIYHVQGAGPTGSPMSYEKLSDVLDRRVEDIDKGEVYFARPNYS